MPEAALHWVPGKIVAGYGVASGRGIDKRYPDGTIRIQQPHFLQKGLDLSPYFSGTLNVDVHPFLPTPRQIVFDQKVKWFARIEERFVLSRIELEAKGCRYAGLWYYPHPETKPEHFQPPTVVELLLPWIEGLAVGETVHVKF